VKVIIVRYQRAAWGVLIALGISILITAFTLVAVNVSVHYLRNASPYKVPFAISMRVIVMVVILAAVGFLTRSKQANSKPGLAAVSPAKPADQEPDNRLETLSLTLARIDPQTPDAKTLRFLLPQARNLRARPGQFLTFE
jgi:amino acid transporter